MPPLFKARLLNRRKLPPRRSARRYDGLSVVAHRLDYWLACTPADDRAVALQGQTVDSHRRKWPPRCSIQRVQWIVRSHTHRLDYWFVLPPTRPPCHHSSRPGCDSRPPKSPPHCSIRRHDGLAEVIPVAWIICLSCAPRDHRAVALQRQAMESPGSNRRRRRSIPSEMIVRSHTYRSDYLSVLPHADHRAIALQSQAVVQIRQQSPPPRSVPSAASLGRTIVPQPTTVPSFFNAKLW